MTQLMVKEEPITKIRNAESKAMPKTGPGLNHSFFQFSVDLVEAPLVPDSFFQGLKECKAGRVVDMETALNEPPPSK